MEIIIKIVGKDTKDQWRLLFKYSLVILLIYVKNKLMFKIKQWQTYLYDRKEK